MCVSDTLDYQFVGKIKPDIFIVKEEVYVLFCNFRMEMEMIPLRATIVSTGFTMAFFVSVVLVVIILEVGSDKTVMAVYTLAQIIVTISGPSMAFLAFKRPNEQQPQ